MEVGAASRPSPKLSSTRSARPRAAARCARPRAIQPLIASPPPGAGASQEQSEPRSDPRTRVRKDPGGRGPRPGRGPRRPRAMGTVNVRMRGDPLFEAFPLFPVTRYIERYWSYLKLETSGGANELVPTSLVYLQYLTFHMHQILLPNYPI